MELMQKYEKDFGMIGVDDLDRWPLESDAVQFLSATASALTVEELKKVGAFLIHSQCKLWNYGCLRST